MSPSAQLVADWGITILLAATWVLFWKRGIIPGRPTWIRRSERPGLFAFGLVGFGAVVIFALVLAILASAGVDFTH